MSGLFFLQCFRKKLLVKSFKRRTVVPLFVAVCHIIKVADVCMKKLNSRTNFEDRMRFFSSAQKKATPAEKSSNSLASAKRILLENRECVQVKIIYNACFFFLLVKKNRKLSIYCISNIEK